MKQQKQYLYGIEELGRKEIDALGIALNETDSLAGDKTVYDVVNERIVEQIEKGNLSWRKGWQAKGGAKNFATKIPYKGVNRLLTSFAHSEWFLTFNQIKQLKGSLKKGAKGLPIIFFAKGYYKNVETVDATGQPETVKEWVKTVPFLKYYTVFAQTDIDKIDFPPTTDPLDDDRSIEVCENLIANMPNKPRFQEGGEGAYYSPSGDYVNMPFKEGFTKVQEYYSVFFHELAHSTGHLSRLNRNLTGNKQTQSYAFEELIAELSASYLCAYSGILFHTINNTAAYLQGWQKRLIKGVQEDSSFFFRAGASAEKAAEYIAGGSLGKIANSKELELVWIPLSDLKTDTKRFQNRDSEYSQRSVDRIVSAFSWNEFDPPKVWIDPNNGKTYIVTGHSRFEAVKQLGHKKIPVIYLQMSEAQAIEFGKYKGNYLADEEGLIPRLRAFGNDEKKLTVKDLKLKYEDWSKLKDWVYLNPNGFFLRFLAVKNYENFPNIRIKAQWAGKLRKQYPKISNEHENEFFDYLFNLNPKIKESTFTTLITGIMNRRALDQTQDDIALGLGKHKRGVAARSDTKQAAARIEELGKEIQKWEAHKKISFTQVEKTATNEEIMRIEAEQKSIATQIGKVLDSQTTMFGISSLSVLQRKMYDFIKGVKGWHSITHTDIRTARALHKKGVIQLREYPKDTAGRKPQIKSIK